MVAQPHEKPMAYQYLRAADPEIPPVPIRTFPRSFTRKAQPALSILTIRRN